MPKLGQYTRILKTVFFLYPDRKSAEQGVGAGGTGFFIGIPSMRWPGHFQHVHGVTNWHVAVYSEDSPPSPVIRVNRVSGAPDILELDPSEWIFRGGQHDLAVSPPLKLTPQHDYVMLDVNSWVISPAEEAGSEIGPADDVFMVGRFVDYDGVETNAPAARFGHISIMAANITQPTGYSGRSIVVDMHSRSGFSGSPVFIYRTIGSHFFDVAPGQFLTGGGHYMRLLGIHWGQFPELWELRQGDKKSAVGQAALNADRHYIEGLSGMTCVIPSKHIGDLLNSPELQAMREANEKERERGTSATSPKAESAIAPPATDENPNH